MNKYNISIVCGVNPFSGPGIIATDIKKGFERDGHCVRIISPSKFNGNDSIVSLYKKSILDNRFFTLLKPYLKKLLLQVFNRPAVIQYKYNMFSLYDQQKARYASKIIENILPGTNVLIFMFSHDFTTAKDLEIVAAYSKVPSLFWLMDCAPLTGGCHFSWDCNHYANNCGNCPAINKRGPNDLSHVNMLNKQRIFSQFSFVPLFGGNKMRNMINNSSLFAGKKSFYVSPPVDKEFYKPNKLDQFKQQYSIPYERKVIFFAANQLSSIRKGMAELISALDIVFNKLSKVERENILLVIAGNNIEYLKEKIGFNFLFLGFLSHKEFAQALQAADFFICPSIEDYGPMVINQSLMSGTPVVSFDMGVGGEFVKTGETGYRAKLGDINDLANGIMNLVQRPSSDLEKMSINCRQLAENSFSIEKITTRFYEVFADMQIGNQ